MSENNNSNHQEDTYEKLHRQFSLFGDDEPAAPEEDDVKNSGEIYFSANADVLYPRDSAGGVSFADQRRDYDWSRFESSSSAKDRPFRSQTNTSAPQPGARQANRQQYAAPRQTPAQPGGSVRQTPSQTNGAARQTPTASGSAARPVRPTVERAYGNARTDARKAAASAAQRPAANGAKQAAAPVQKKKKGRARAVIEAADDLIEGKNGKQHSGWVLALVVLVIVVAVSLMLRVPIVGCMNDILAINRDDTEIRVVVDPNMTTNDVIDLLAKKDLLYSGTFCKLAYDLLGHDPKEIYPAGTYTVSANMGLEGMMREIITAGATESTVKLSFPEGYTVDQIINKLASNGVASSSALYGVIDSVEFIESYDFLTFIQDREQRYHYLEGYLYPDTYEFYIGENPQSVINRFLKNFSEKWNENFEARCEKFSYSMDEVLTVASILEKEAKDAEQMPLVASILYNRLESSSFEFINCDSTAKYIDNNKEKLVASGRYASLLKVYDTYQIAGLPVGPICNPGADAIDAALSPDNTDYYYFIHDKNGTIYVASTLSEHQANLAKAEIE